jgi:4-hydroxy-tetrahydrodipicolinate synthase
MYKDFKGSIVALITPFREGDLDIKKFCELIELHISKGTDGIVIGGTTGEAPTLVPQEKQAMIENAQRIVKGKIPIIAGAGSNSTKESIAQVKFLEKLKVDGLLVVVPYYNRPSQEGLYQHFESIADSTDLPIILYNVPSRTGVNLEPQTIARLSEKRNIVALKDASGNLDHVTRVKELSQIDLLSGDDPLTYLIMCIGGKGVISVAANIIPQEMASLTKSAMDGDFERAKQLHLQFYDLLKAMFIETNPVPVKAAMKLMGMLNGELRPPLTELKGEKLEILRDILHRHKLI